VIKKPRKNEEAKARYWAVKIQPQWVVTTGKQTNNILITDQPRGLVVTASDN
jgi:hypothetical protein